MRHYLCLEIIYATLTKFRTVGPFELDWDTEQYKCWISQYVTFALLASLQAVNLFWLYLILRIAKNYVFVNEWADERSDAEDDDEDEDFDPKKMLEEDKGADSDTPAVLLNGHAVQEAEGKPEGIKARRPRKA